MSIMDTETQNVNGITKICHNQGMTSKKEEHVLHSAREVFLRYGFTRTTMADVAKAAGISRPALYLLFPGKEHIYSAVIHKMNEEALRDICNGIQASDTLEHKLGIALERWVARSWDLERANPDAGGFFDHTLSAVQEIYAEFQTYLAGLMADAVQASPLEVSPEELARTLLYSLWGPKAIAKDGEELRRMIAVQVSVVVAALGLTHPGASADTQ